ncbi:MAG: hypothetical protein ACI9CA_001407 [Natronomonas sp.]
MVVDRPYRSVREVGVESIGPFATTGSPEGAD